MKVIIENDDFGLNFGFTQGIIQGHKNGITTSTCLRSNGLAYKESIKLLKSSLGKKIGLGIHIDLTDGPFLTRERLTKFSGYGASFVEVLFRSYFFPKNFLYLLEKEADSQITKALKVGLKIDHLNGHNNIHMIPPVFRITCKLAKKYKIKYIRLANEPLHLPNDIRGILKIITTANILRVILLQIFSYTNKRFIKEYNLTTSDAFYGLLYANDMTADHLIDALKDGLKRNYSVMEIGLHPAIANLALDKKFDPKQSLLWYTNLRARKDELSALESREVKQFIQKHNIALIACSNL